MTHIYPRKCSYTGKGIASGYLFCDGSILCDEAPNAAEILTKECAKGGYDTIEAAFDAEYYLYTEWEEPDEDEMFFESGAKATLQTMSDGWVWYRVEDTDDMTLAQLKEVYNTNIGSMELVAVSEWEEAGSLCEAFSDMIEELAGGRVLGLYPEAKPEPKKEFRITVRASFNRIYTVMAADKEEAAELYYNGKSEWLEDQTEDTDEATTATVSAA